MKWVISLFAILSACKAETKTPVVPPKVACPSEISEGLKLESGVHRYGILSGKKILYTATLVTGGPSDTIKPVYNEDPLDEWESTPHGSRAVAEYDPGTHDGMNLLCDYFPKGKFDGKPGGFQNTEGRVTLLLPLPDQAGLKCIFIRNPSKSGFSGTCDLAY